MINQKFSTKDMGLAAALVSAGFYLFSINKSDPRRVVFFFGEKTTDIETAVDQYWAETLTVNARIYFNNLKMLKNRIYSD